MLAYDYPILGLFWTMFVFFLWVMWFFLLFKVVIDIFRSHDLSGWGKTGWFILVLVVPFLGVFIYVIARGQSMGERDLRQAQAQEQAFRSYVQDVASTGGGTAAELAKLAELRDSGVITAEEFERQKAKVLA